MFKTTAPIQGTLEAGQDNPGCGKAAPGHTGKRRSSKPGERGRARRFGCGRTSRCASKLSPETRLVLRSLSAKANPGPELQLSSNAKVYGIERATEKASRSIVTGRHDRHWF
jgi:hypothetical protein